MCAKYHAKLETKNSVEGFTKRIGFLVGPCANAASTELHTYQLVESINKAEGALEMKKQSTCERGVSSEALVVYGLE